MHIDTGIFCRNAINCLCLGPLRPFGTGGERSYLTTFSLPLLQWLAEEACPRITASILGLFMQAQVFNLAGNWIRKRLKFCCFSNMEPKWSTPNKFVPGQNVLVLDFEKMYSRWTEMRWRRKMRSQHLPNLMLMRHNKGSIRKTCQLLSCQ